MSMSYSCELLSQLASIKGLGLKTFYHLRAHFGNIDKIFTADFATFKSIGIKPVMARAIVELNENVHAGRNCRAIDKQRDWASQEKQNILCVEDAAYPEMLKEVFCPPPMIYAKGCLASMNLPCLSMVGSRKPSIAGQQHAYEFARDLSFNGFNIVSGLALGVDTQAHRGAIGASGITCAVLGTGLDVIYPKQNLKLADEIVEKGVLISEMSLGSLPVPANFPRRNRVVSGLSSGTLIVEAGLKSGSLITAAYAVEQNREVYVIPGPIDSAVAAGCNALIKQGAQLVTCVEDILSDSSCSTVLTSGSAANVTTYDELNDLNSQETELLAHLAYQCTSFDMLMSASGFAAGELMQSLVSLELKGLIYSVPGGYQRVKSVNSSL